MNPNLPHKALLFLKGLVPMLGFGFLSVPLFCQLSIEWDRTYGGSGWEELQAMIATSDGGYLFAGLTTTDPPDFEVLTDSRGNGDYWIIKTDGNGVPQMSNRFGGVGMDRIWSVSETVEGGYILAGESESGVEGDKNSPNRGGLDYWLIKVGPNLQIEWQKEYGGTGNDVLRAVIPHAGGYFLAGYSDSNTGFEKTQDSRGNDDYWIIQTDASGNVLWDKTIGGTEQDRLFDAIKVADGFILAGYAVSGIGFEKTQASFGKNDYWIIKIDPSGNIIWQQTLGGLWEETCLSVLASPPNKLLICGFSASPANTGNKTAPYYGSSDAWLVMLNDEGNTASIDWQQSFGGSEGDIAYAAARNVGGNYLIAGVSFSKPDLTPGGGKEAPNLGANDYWAFMLKPDGERIWDMTLGGQDIESCTKVILGHDYGFLLAGHSSSNVSPPYKSQPSRGFNDMWVIRTGCHIDSLSMQETSPVCPNTEIELDATIPTCTDCMYVWDDGPVGAKRSVTASAPTQLKVTVTHPDGCKLRDSLMVNVTPGPVGFIAVVSPVSCFDKTDGELAIDSVMGGSPPYKYSLNGSSSNDFSHFYNLGGGNHTVSVFDRIGCRFDSVYHLAQPESVLVDLGPDIFLKLGDSVQLQAHTTPPNPSIIIWGQSEALSCTDCLNPWVQPYQTSTFNLTIKDSSGCEGKDFVRVIVNKNYGAYIPNAFSPNGDGVNDFFTIYGDGSINEIKALKIFDRWGEKMFELNDFQPNQPQTGWDGKFRGKDLKPGTFAYWAEIQFLDGRIEFYKGSLTLVR